MKKMKKELSVGRNCSLYKEKYDRYKKCKHIFIVSAALEDVIEGRTEYFHGCIKCGLNELDMTRAQRNRKRYDRMSSSMLAYDDALLEGFLSGFGVSGVDFRCLFDRCDIDLARAIYLKILEKWPDIDDETAISCFRKILNDIREEIKKDESNKEVIENNLKVRKLGPVRWFPKDIEI